ncbi:MAG: hypothetical protein ACYDGZ_23140 [Desulfosporosinus fructosivorans]
MYPKWMAQSGSESFVHTPIYELVSEFNKFRPAILTGYGTVISMLADEQAAGRLNINPV